MTFRSVHTVNTHINRAKSKNEIKNTPQLTSRFSLEYGAPLMHIPLEFRKGLTVLLVVGQLGMSFGNNPIQIRTIKRVKTTKKIRKRETFVYVQ